MTAWIGSHDTQVNIPAAAVGTEFYRSSAVDCDLAHYASCADGQLDFLNGSVVTDTAATLSRVGYYVLKLGNQQAHLTVSAAHFSARSGYQVVTYHYG